MKIPIHVYCHGHVVPTVTGSVPKTQKTPRSIDVHITAGGLIHRRHLVALADALTNSLTKTLNQPAH